ncbi:MAG: AMIN domain-containing protein, partial [Deltaproteobacteria bacterium]|nr:AMIN domain-containing protein [Deltaproteobacteria bacterium]
MIRHITAPINTTIITAVAAIVLALPVYSLAAGGSSYYGEEDLVILSEAKATEVATRAVEELLKNSKEKLTRALASGKASEEAKISKAAATTKKKEETLGYQATKITSIASKNHHRATAVTISADGDIGEYDSFVLDSPARLVVDVWDIGSELSSRTVSIDIDSEYVEKVRVGTHPGKVRLV